MAHRQYTLAFYIFTGRHHFGGFALPPGAALLVEGKTDTEIRAPCLKMHCFPPKIFFFFISLTISFFLAWKHGYLHLHDVVRDADKTHTLLTWGSFIHEHRRKSNIQIHPQPYT